MDIEWIPKKEMPPKIDCKYGKFLSVRKDVTSLVNSRMRLIAVRPLTEDERDTYNQFGPDNYKFKSDRKYDCLSAFAEDLVSDFPNGLWEVTNVTNTDHYSIKHVGNKPHDVGYTIVFAGCPWDIFLRYWRKPIRLKSKLSYRRYYKKGLPNKTKNKNIDILSFSQTLNDWLLGTRPAMKFLNNQVILSDFRYAFSERKRNSIDQEIADWMMENVSSFKLITDESTPFCDAVTELCFTTDILGKYRDEED